MGYHDSNIPSDPVKNLARLKSIADNYKRKLTYKEDLLSVKQTSLDKLQKVMDETGEPEELTETELVEATAREQIMMGYKIEIEELLQEINQIHGKLISNKKRQGIVGKISQRSDTLKYKAFASLKNS